MIQVNSKYKNNNIRYVNITGHANYDEYGKDIVCASVSSIVITTINGILEIDDEAISWEDLDNKITIEVLKDEEIVYKLLKNMMDLLEQLAFQYEKCIKIYKEEI